MCKDFSMNVKVVPWLLSHHLALSSIAFALHRWRPSKYEMRTQMIENNLKSSNPPILVYLLLTHKDAHGSAAVYIPFDRTYRLIALTIRPPTYAKISRFIIIPGVPLSSNSSSRVLKETAGRKGWVVEESPSTFVDGTGPPAFNIRSVEEWGRSAGSQRLGRSKTHFFREEGETLPLLLLLFLSIFFFRG